MKKSIKLLSKEILNSQYEGYQLNAFDIKEKVYNFSPGPAPIPSQVLDSIKEDLNISYPYGITPFEISHRSPEFISILKNVNKNIRIFLKVPETFSIIWTQGGGHGQFSAIPLNLKYLFLENSKANYAVTGTWSERSFKESQKFLKSYNSFFKNENELSLSYTGIPNKFNIDKDDKYLYLCSNETVNGIEFRNDGIPYPDRSLLKDTKLIIDMSSDMCMKDINWENLDVAFACTSKNLGVAGANITIIRKDLLEELENKNKLIPCTLDWNLYNNSNSLYNTPAIFNIYMIDKILNYYLDKGGIEYFEKISKIKSSLVYDLLDNSKLYKPVISDKKIRSNINIPFIVGDGDDETRHLFLDFCYKNNIVGLRTKTPFNYKELNIIEPLRISLYNGISVEDTEKLVKVMKQFEYVYNITR